MSSFNTNTNSIIKSITSGFASDLTPMSEIPSKTATASASSLTTNNSNFFSNITWQTWIIIILILALLGINIFTYLARGTQGAVSIFDQIFAPILKFFGFVTIETTKQTIENTQAGTNAAVNAVANTSVGALNTAEQIGGGTGTGTGTGTNSNSIPLGKMANPSQGISFQTEGKIEQYKEDALEKALSNASQSANEVQPSESSASVGKSGWCYIGEDLGVRTCTNIGVNDVCMSGDIFPTQAVCINPSLRP
jgi:hypothetical protein